MTKYFPLLLIILATACEKKGDEFYGKLSLAEDAPFCEDNQDPNLICNPFGGDDKDDDIPDTKKSRLGLIGRLYEGKANFNTLDRYFSEGLKHPNEIYFSNFNVPSRAFDDGFGNGQDFLLSTAGDKLIEWFAVEAKGKLLLPQNEESGFFEVVTISDDGIRVNVGGETIIDNPSVHAPFINCASKLIELKKGEPKLFDLKYFQGPRYHIALVVLIKRIEDPSLHSKNRLCSTSGGTTAGLESEGYKVVGSSWFTLPDGY